MRQGRRPNARAASLFLLVMWGICLGCSGSGKPDKSEALTVISKSLMKERAAVKGIPGKIIAPGSGSLGYNYWVAGTVRNISPYNVRNIVLVFEGTDGEEPRKMMAEIGHIPAGGEATYKSYVLPSIRDITLLQEPPEIQFDWDID